MSTRNHNQPPIFDLNTLNERHEIHIEYDANGNPTRIRKVRRFDGCFVWLLLTLGAAYVAWKYIL